MNKHLSFLILFLLNVIFFKNVNASEAQFEDLGDHTESRSRSNSSQAQETTMSQDAISSPKKRAAEETDGKIEQEDEYYLPRELWHLIFYNLHQNTLMPLKCVSKYFKQLVETAYGDKPKYPLVVKNKNLTQDIVMYTYFAQVYPNLEFLYPLTPDQITALSSSTKLQTLTVQIRTDQNEKQFNCLSSLTNLTSLKLTSSGLRTADSLLGLTNLHELNLARNELIDVSGLSKLTNLWKLDLFQNKLINISGYSILTQLEDLNLANNRLGDIPELPSLTQLRNLNLNNTQQTDILRIITLTQLQKLDLGANLLTEIPEISNLVNLRLLNLVFNQLTNISELTHLTQIQKLALYNNQLKNVSGLETLINLHHFYIEYPLQAQFHVLRGAFYARQYLYEKAITEFKCALEIKQITDKDKAYVYTALGGIHQFYSTPEMDQQAIAYFQNALTFRSALHPQQVPHINNALKILYDRNR